MFVTIIRKLFLYFSEFQSIEKLDFQLLQNKVSVRLRLRAQMTN